MADKFNGVVIGPDFVRPKRGSLAGRFLDLASLGPEWADAFWARVDRSGGPDACWLWTRGTLGGALGGYGLVYVGTERQRVATKAPAYRERRNALDRAKRAAQRAAKVGAL